MIILTLDHGEAVEAEDVAVLDPPAGQGVVCPVRVEPRLEPDPGVLQLRPVPRLLAAGNCDNCVCEGVPPPTLHLMWRYMASTPALATSHSMAPAPTAARHAQPPTSAVAAPSLITWGGVRYRRGFIII